MNITKYLFINISSLYIGLKFNWLTNKEFINFFNKNFDKFNCDEKILIDINLNENEKLIILEIVCNQFLINENLGIKYWQIAHLLSIEQLDLSIKDKLKEIELQWSKFDYPDSWRNFIYYLPNNEISTEKDVYQLFLNFITEEKIILNINSIYL